MKFLPHLKGPNLAALRARLKWIRKARHNQITPEGDWRIWLILAGRGWGKTRTGAEDIASYVLFRAGVRVGVIAPTFSDARDVCVEGESGLLRVLPPSCVAAWHRSTGDIRLHNGSQIKLYSADQPERLRGPQHHRVWCDELGAWPSRAAFDQMLFGLRLGKDPRVVITTTPRNIDILRELVAREGQDVFLTRGSTFDNKKNLAATVLENLRKRYEGTRLGRQELEAELLTDVQGALWSAELIEKAQVDTCPELEEIIVAIDPAMTHGAKSDETGIIAAGRSREGTIYILEDVSCKETPEKWAQRAANLLIKVGGDKIVAEVNAGGALVERILRQSAPDVYVKSVRAVRGKMARALPVAALYEQGRVKHATPLQKLEDQMTRFTIEEIERKSPDRVDALVWAVTELSDIARARPRIRQV